MLHQSVEWAVRRKRNYLHIVSPQVTRGHIFLMKQREQELSFFPRGLVWYQNPGSRRHVKTLLMVFRRKHVVDA